MEIREYKQLTDGFFKKHGDEMPGMLLVFNTNV